MIQGIVHNWPKCNSQNEIVVLDELEKIIASVSHVAIAPVLGILLAHLRHCIDNGTVLVAMLMMRVE